jgi:drug/metabolite transporter (DMT)-like permease
MPSGLTANESGLMNARKCAVIAGIVFCSSFGNVMLSRGMHQIGNITLANWTGLFTALFNPWVVLGTLLLIGFMTCWMNALSWADLTYVLPASAFGYIVTAMLARFVLHETVTSKRWIGVLLITAGVGFVAGGPSVTPPTVSSAEPEAVPEPEEQLR